MVSLVRAELHLMDAALAGDEVLAQALGHDVVPGWATFTEALGPTRDAVAAGPSGSAWSCGASRTRDLDVGRRPMSSRPDRRHTDDEP